MQTCGGHSVTIEAYTTLARVCVLWRSGSSMELSALWEQHHDRHRQFDSQYGKIDNDVMLNQHLYLNIAGCFKLERVPRGVNTKRHVLIYCQSRYKWDPQTRSSTHEWDGHNYNAFDSHSCGHASLVSFSTWRAKKEGYVLQTTFSYFVLLYKDCCILTRILLFHIYSE